ncbi:hypothetical protein TorRG33x02_312400, partial [Trema orientale]
NLYWRRFRLNLLNQSSDFGLFELILPSNTLICRRTTPKL